MIIDELSKEKQELLREFYNLCRVSEGCIKPYLSKYDKVYNSSSNYHGYLFWVYENFLKKLEEDNNVDYDKLFIMANIIELSKWEKQYGVGFDAHKERMKNKPNIIGKYFGKEKDIVLGKRVLPITPPPNSPGKDNFKYTAYEPQYTGYKSEEWKYTELKNIGTEYVDITEDVIKKCQEKDEKVIHTQYQLKNNIQSFNRDRSNPNECPNCGMDGIGIECNYCKYCGVKFGEWYGKINK